MINWKELDGKTAEQKLALLDKVVKDVCNCRYNIILNDKIDIKTLNEEKAKLEQQ